MLRFDKRKGATIEFRTVYPFFFVLIFKMPFSKKTGMMASGCSPRKKLTY
eukprot:UN24108